MKTGRTAALVVAHFYPDIAAGLVESCRARFARAEVGCEVFSVPGALEVAPAIARIVRAAPGRFFCFAALGCVIRGETYHFEVVAEASAVGLVQVQLACDVAVGNGILTVDNAAQARARWRKGAAAAEAALALAALSPETLS